MTIVAVAARPLGAGRGPEESANGGRRFYDAATSSWLVKVYPGEFRVTSQPDETLVTVLGSCVAACIRDPKTGFALRTFDNVGVQYGLQAFTAGTIRSR